MFMAVYQRRVYIMDLGSDMHFVGADLAICLKMLDHQRLNASSVKVQLLKLCHKFTLQESEP